MPKLNTVGLTHGRRPTLSITLEDPAAGIPATEIVIRRLGAIEMEGVTPIYKDALLRFIHGGWEKDKDGKPLEALPILFADGSRVPVNEDALWLACVLERSQVAEVDRYEVEDFLRIGAASDTCWKQLTDALSEVAETPKAPTA